MRIILSTPAGYEYQVCVEYLRTKWRILCCRIYSGTDHGDPTWMEENVSSRWSTPGKSLEEEHWIGDTVTHCGCTLAQEQKSLWRSGSVVEGSRTCLTLDKHLNDNSSDRRPRCSTESNRKTLSKGIESSTVLDVGNTEALRGRHKNLIGRSFRRSFGNPAACNKPDPIPFPLIFPPMI